MSLVVQSGRVNQQAAPVNLQVQRDIISRLPEELFEMVMDNLSVLDLARARRINKQFAQFQPLPLNFLTEFEAKTVEIYTNELNQLKKEYAFLKEQQNPTPRSICFKILKFSQPILCRYVLSPLKTGLEKVQYLTANVNRNIVVVISGGSLVAGALLSPAARVAAAAVAIPALLATDANIKRVEQMSDSLNRNSLHLKFRHTDCADPKLTQIYVKYMEECRRIIDAYKKTNSDREKRDEKPAPMEPALWYAPSPFAVSPLQQYLTALQLENGIRF